LKIVDSVGWLSSLGGVFVELIHKILVDAANATRDSLKADADVDDRGALSSLAAELYDYITGADVDVTATVARFLDRLFAAVYLHGPRPSGTVECVATVRRHVGALGGLEAALAEDLGRSGRVARDLVESLRVAGVVAESLTSVDFSHQCSRALTRLSYCAACDGVVDPALPRPCRPFCDNVARGCFVHLVAGQIGRRWEHFIDAVNQLGSFGVTSRNDLESVVADLPKLLSDNVTRLQADLHNYHAQVRFYTHFTFRPVAFSALTLLVGHHEEHPACKN